MEIDERTAEATQMIKKNSKPRDGKEGFDPPPRSDSESPVSSLVPQPKGGVKRRRPRFEKSHVFRKAIG
jgi:hypothetical protein